MQQNDPFSRLPPVPAFTLTGRGVRDRQPLPAAQMAAASGAPGGLDRSPHLRWTGAPEATASYVVTVYDPDAPTGSGFWHWAVANIPAAVTELPEGAGDDNGSGLPDGVVQFPNDARLARFIGAAPPAGHGPHRYYLTVHALDVADIGVPADSTPAFLGFVMGAHTLARATIVATAETPAAPAR